MKYRIFATLLSFVSLSLSAVTLGNNPLNDLKNFQVNTPTMVSSGQPNQAQFSELKAQGVKQVIDLIPGDRSEQRGLMDDMNLVYYNIPVEWDAPKREDFILYVSKMEQTPPATKTLTHCKLNYRGAVFTYLYRVTQLGHSEQDALKDLLAIWQPNETWQQFINDVKAHYQITRRQ